MDRVKNLYVYYDETCVGTLALYNNLQVAFEYSKEWLAEGFSISPFSLPLKSGVFIPKIDPFDGLYGVFADSLPDGWGRLLVDRYMRKKGVDANRIGNLDRLAIVGNSGMGALTYRPVLPIEYSNHVLSIDEMAKECRQLLETDEADNLDILFKNGGSSGGARPKILTKIYDEDWIIKFPSSEDNNNIGRQEYEYALCAQECGIEMEQVKLFDSELCDGYFGTRRFDRKNGKKIHMASVSAILETSHRIPNLDYELLMRLTLQLTKSMEECEKLFRLMCFNVFAHNRDDHSKNFSFIYDKDERRWLLSPAYDLTYSNSIGGEHATTIHGIGDNPGMSEILAVAQGIGINKNKAQKIANNIKECVTERLAEYL